MPGWTRKTSSHQTRVSLSRIQGGAVEEVQESVVAGRFQSQGAHDTGDAQQILASGESRQAEGHPQEGSGPGAGGPQIAHQIPPVIPEHEAASWPGGAMLRHSGLDSLPRG